jgi:hypothetical protein
VPVRLARQKKDPWTGYFTAKQRLTKKVIAAVESLAS